MRLTADVRLARNSHLINECESTGQCFRCFCNITCSTWQSAKQIWQLLVGTLEREEGNNNDKFAVSLLKDATVIGHVSQEFSRVF